VIFYTGELFTELKGDVFIGGLASRALGNASANEALGV
jgi:glucose/arabinose dehydrogenase